MSVVIYPPTRHMSFHYGDECIAYERVRRQGGSRRVQIRVHPDCRVVVAAPDHADDALVLESVKKRGRWIYEKLRDFRKQQAHVIPRRYVSGESHYYLGKQYLLKIVEMPGQPQAVKLLRGRLEVSVRHKNPETVRRLLTDWYRVRAREVFTARRDALLEQTLWVSEVPPLRILAMQTQWGSCSPNGRLTLNPHLVKAPRECIDYVILHELCHLAEHNHSERFYRLMTQVMPAWEKTKTRLDDMAGKILDEGRDNL